MARRGRWGLTWDGNPTVKPPFGAAELDRAHPLADRLASALVLTEGAGYDLARLDFTQQQSARYTTNSYANAPPSWGITTRGIGVVVAQPVSGWGSYLNFPNGLAIPASSDFSDFWIANITSLSGGNPGLWRSGSGADGGTFHIFQGGSNRVWVRLNGTDILQPGSGTALTTGAHSEGISLRSGASVTEYIDGVQTQTATHAVATPADSVYIVGYQYDLSNIVAGTYVLFYFWRRALTASDYAWLHVEPYAFLRPRVARRWFVAAVGGTTWPGWVSSRGGWS